VAAVLSGKWVWVWNWRRCLGGAQTGGRLADPSRVARRLHEAGCAGAIVKSDDGGHPFDQGRPVWEIVHALQQEGLRAGCWGYVYGCDSPSVIYGDLKYTWAEEAAMAARFITERPSPSYHGPDLYVVDVEAEYERQPADPLVNAERYLQAVRIAVGPTFPLAYAPLAQPDYHRRLPYAVFQRHCRAVLPQAYHNAMDVSPERSLALTYDAFGREGLLALPVAPAGGAYGTVTPDELRRWAAEAVRRGARMLSWWSFEHIENERPELWDAIAAVILPPASDEEGEMVRWERGSRLGWAVDAPFAPGEYRANARADYEVPVEARSLLLYVQVRELSPADHGDAGRGGVDLYNGGSQGIEGVADRLFTEGGEYRGRQVRVWLDGDGGYRLRVFGATVGLDIRCLAYGM
jgi:hypothetical protein